jgi:hypothetical protein
MILGIDVGARGAIAVLDQSGALQEIHDMPVLQDGPKGRRSVNAPLSYDSPGGQFPAAPLVIRIDTS